MRVTISTEYDEDAGDFVTPVTIDVPAPPVSGDALVHAYEVEDSENGIALSAWAREQFGPYAKVESVVVEDADEPMLVGCEFVVSGDAGRLTGLVAPESHTEARTPKPQRAHRDPMSRLRKAIIEDVAEDMSMIGDLTEWHEQLVTAWNAVPGVEPITGADIDGEFES